MGLSQSSTANVTLAPSLLPCNTPRAQRLSTTLQAIPSNLVAMGQQKPKPSHATRLRFYLRTISSGQKLVETCDAAPKEREKALRELKFLHDMASKMESRLKELSAGTATATTSTEAPSLWMLALGDSITQTIHDYQAGVHPGDSNTSADVKDAAASSGSGSPGEASTVPGRRVVVFKNS